MNYILLKKMLSDCIIGLTREVDIMDEMYKNGYEAIDIARYVVNKSIEKGNPISNLKLQKILYFIQGNFYKIKSTCCFVDEIYAWEYGPVVPNIYTEFRGYGSNNIPEIKKILYYNFENKKFGEKEYSYENIDKNDRHIIDDVILLCENYNVYELVDLTHKQRPWIDAYEVGMKKLIPKNKIGEFFING